MMCFLYNTSILVASDLQSVICTDIIQQVPHIVSCIRVNSSLTYMELCDYYLNLLRSHDKKIICIF